MAASALLQAGQRSAAIAREALKVGTCYFCVGALLGVRQPSFYTLPASEVHTGLASFLGAVATSPLEVEPLQQQDAQNVCPVCLGILQHHDLQHDSTCARKTAPSAAAPDAAAQAAPQPGAKTEPHSSPTAALIDAIRSKQYDSRRFFIGVRIPTSVPMRQHALRAFVCEQLGMDRLPGDMTSVKDAVRSRILTQLTAATQSAQWQLGGGTGPLVEDTDLKAPVQSCTMDTAALAEVGLEATSPASAAGEAPLGEQPEGGLRLQVHFVHAACDAELQGLKSARTAGMSLLAAHSAIAAGEAPPKSKRSRTTRDNRYFTAPSHKDVAEALEGLSHTNMPAYVPGLVPLHWLPESLPNTEGYAVPPLPPSLEAPAVTPGPAPLHEYMEWRRQHYTGSPADLGKGVGSGGDLRLRLYTTDKTHTFPACPPRVSSTSVFQVDAMRTPVYLTGRYNKLQRGVSQSPWGFAPSKVLQADEASPKDRQLLRDGIRQDTEGVPDERSVSESVARVLRPALGAPPDSSNFSAAGREDIDVRMLGSGRPFAIEITDASRTVLSAGAIQQLQGLMNANKHGVRITGLCMATPAEYSAMQKGAEEKQKTYAALVWCNIQLSEKELVAAVDCADSQLIQQSTPVRVMHRRALMLRERRVLRRRAQWLDGHFFILHLTTTAGAYVKEFVHGDLGRTSPSLADLMAQRLGVPPKEVQCDIATLDVVDVAFAQGGTASVGAAEWGQDMQEVTQEATALVQAAKAGGLLHHPILGTIPNEAHTSSGLEAACAVSSD